MSTPSDEYKLWRLTQLQAAIERHDGEATVAVLRLVQFDGYVDYAAEVTDHLVRVGLESVAAGR